MSRPLIYIALLLALLVGIFGLMDIGGDFLMTMLAVSVILMGIGIITGS